MTDVSELINILQFSTGRRRYACAQVLAVLEELKQQAMVSFVKDSLAADEKTAELERRYYADRAASAGRGPVAVHLDNHLDRVVGALSERIDGLISVFDATQDTGKRARALKLEVFPNGGGALTHSSFEEALSTAHHLVKQLRGLLAGDVAALHLGLLVDELESTTRSFQVALHEEPKVPVGFDAVRAARASGQRRLERLIAKLLASDDLDGTQRARALAPILEQNARIRSYYTRRRPVPEVDPVSGQELPVAGDPHPAAAS